VVDFFILILYYVASGEIAVFQSDEEGKVFWPDSTELLCLISIKKALHRLKIT
jgi:hypothetical protein